MFLIGAEARAWSAASYYPTPIKEMASLADLIVVGEVVRLDLPEVLFRCDDAVWGDLQSSDVSDGGLLRVRGFSNWSCASRFAPYAAGQRSVLFLRRLHDRDGDSFLAIMSGGGEGEMPITGPIGGRQRLLLRSSDLLPERVVQLGPSFSGIDGASGWSLRAHPIDLAVFVKAIRAYRSGFSLTVDRSGDYPSLKSVRWAGDDAGLEMFRRSSAFARSLADASGMWEFQKEGLRESFYVPDSYSPKSSDRESALDSSGVDAFFDVSESLLRDEEPESDDWDALLQTPGYALLSEARVDIERVMRVLLPLALRPSMADKREAMAGRVGGPDPLIAYFREAASTRDELTAAVEKFENLVVVAAAQQAVSDWLPKSSWNDSGRLAVSVVIFPGDAYATDGRVVFDLALIANRLRKYPRSTFFQRYEVCCAPIEVIDPVARALFRLRRSELRANEGSVSGPDGDLISIIDGLQREGVALSMGRTDLFDDEGIDSPLVRVLEEGRVRFRDVLGHADNMLRHLDFELARYAKDRVQASACVEALQSDFEIYSAPVGYHMASVVAAAFAEPRLAEHSTDPFRFFRDYQEAARHLDVGFHVFSDEAMEAVERLCRLEQD